jgi:import inner membrane translocase subunit TIM44
MQLDDVEYTHEDGRKYTAPTWQLREMVLRGMMAVAA